LLLYAKDVKEASSASAMLVDALGLASCLKPLDVERLLQVWILNCFEHSDDPLGYSVYFMSSFMSHSCLPNTVWHYDGDDYVLRARCVIEENNEISISYLSEDSLLESIPARRKHLRDSKHFICSCMRCTAACDKSRGFKCPKCRHTSFYEKQATATSGKLAASGDITGASCNRCQHCLSKCEASFLVAEEREFESKLNDLERRIDRGRNKHSSLLKPLETALIRAECSLCQHWLLDKAWQVAADLYDRNERQEDAQVAMRKRIAFQEEAFPGLSGTHAWTLEAYADMLVRHSSSAVEPHVSTADIDALRRVEPQEPHVSTTEIDALRRVEQQASQKIYAEALQILRLMFGESHEYYTAVNRKAVDLEHQLKRRGGTACTIDNSVSSER